MLSDVFVPGCSIFVVHLQRSSQYYDNVNSWFKTFRCGLLTLKQWGWWHTEWEPLQFTKTAFPLIRTQMSTSDLAFLRRWMCWLFQPQHVVHITFTIMKPLAGRFVSCMTKHLFRFSLLFGASCNQCVRNNNAYKWSGSRSRNLSLRCRLSLRLSQRAQKWLVEVNEHRHF